MAIQTVTATINGQPYTLTYNGSTGKYEATITAPSTTSYNVNGGHYYPVSVTATNDAGTSTTVNDTNDNGTTMNLKLRVREKTKPTATITAPSSGAKLTVAKPTVTVQVRDEAGGSGINIGSLTISIDGGATQNNTSAGVTCTPVSNGYDITYVVQANIADGSHTLNVSISDNDGNTQSASSTFQTDTLAPSLNITAPSNGLVTNQASLTVSGTVSDATSNPITVTITRNGTDMGAVSVVGGSFNKAITLVEGTNNLRITATDNSLLSYYIDRTVTLNTGAPTISAVTLTPNPVDGGQTFVIAVTVSG